MQFCRVLDMATSVWEKIDERFIFFRIRDISFTFLDILFYLKMKGYKRQSKIEIR